VRRSVINTDATKDPLTFGTTSLVVEEIGERYGRWQDGECLDLKAALIKLGDQGVGRVLLKDFYGDALGGGWQFSESVDYLRDLGALDESDPARVSVIVPNYLNSPTNCLATSSIFSVCCIDECEALLGHLEREASAPDVAPDRILELVSGLPSASVEAPRKLPSSLVSRLDDVARHHGGRVPLHGRLFSQWMHHAYPRECPYPHVSGTTRPQIAEEWMQGGSDVSASREEMKQHVESASAPTLAEFESRGALPKKESGMLQWEDREELFVERLPARGLASPGCSVFAAIFRNVVLFGALLAMAFGLKDAVRAAFGNSNKFGAKMSKSYLPHSHSV